MSDEPHRVEVVEYDPAWPRRFARERDALQVSLASWLAGPIEHVGSTAVPGLCAKPVIDIMVPTRSLDDSRPAIAVLEAEHGYTYWPYKADVMHWFCKPSDEVRTHHVHLIPVSSRLFRERLFFRGALLRDADLRRRYAALKQNLAARFAYDREAYTQAKGPFVAEVVARMRA
ncbi:MAG: GrpB family protein [Myxococcota bacterium]